MKKTLFPSVASFMAVIAILPQITGCQSKEEEKVPERELYTNVPLYMAGNTIPSDSQEKYLYNPEVKKYSVGRRIDGNGVMHEAGVFYRIEKGPEWNLIPQYDALPKSLMTHELHERYANVATSHIQRTIKNVEQVRRDILDSQKKQFQEGEALLRLKEQLEQAEKSKAIMAENIKLLKELLDRQEKRLNKLERMPKELNR